MNRNDIYTLNFNNNHSVEVNIPKNLAGDYSIIKLVKDTRQVDLTMFDYNDTFMDNWNYFVEEGNIKVVNRNIESVLNFYNVVDYLGLTVADKIYHTIQLSLIFYSKHPERNFRFLDVEAFRPIDEIEPNVSFLNFAFNNNKTLVSDKNRRWLSFREFRFSRYFAYVFMCIREEDYQPGKIKECKDVYVLFENSWVYYHFPSVKLNFKDVDVDREKIFAVIENQSIQLNHAVKYADLTYLAQDFRRKRESRQYVMMSVANRAPNFIEDSENDSDDEHDYTYYRVFIKYEDFLSRYLLGMKLTDAMTGYFENVIVMKVVMINNLFDDYSDKNYYYEIPHAVFLSMDDSGKVKVLLNHIDTVEKLIEKLPKKVVPIFWQTQIGSPWNSTDFSLCHFPEIVGIKNYNDRVVF